MDEPNRRWRWMPVVLVASLALNLAVAAAVGGAMWRFHGRDGHHGRHMSGQAPLLFALDREDRREIRRQMRPPPGERGAHMRQMVALLRSTPFDADAVKQVLETQRGTSLRLQDAASAVWLRRVGDMSDEERARYASRLEELVSRRGKPGEKRAE